ncbi:hypothetical protein EC82524_3333, partial [Escherichia coli 8.2524]
LVILFTSFSGSLVSRISGAVQVINWAGDDPDKLSFARNVAARQPEMLEPQNQKLLENGYANFLRIQKARGEQARDESASSASQFIRGLKQNYAQ